MESSDDDAQHTRTGRKKPATGVVKAAFLAAFVFLCACSKEQAAPKVHTDKVLTMLFYLGGDNNLSDETYAKLTAIATSPSVISAADSVNILIYHDTAQNGYPRLWRVTGSPGTYAASPEKLEHLELVASYPGQSSSSPQSLAAALELCRTRFPAPSYGLWVFSHGTGWLPTGQTVTRSLIVDGNSEMDIRDFAAAIPDRMLDFIVFEMCYMASAEVVYQLRGKAEHTLASCAEMVSPGFLEIYTDALDHIFASRSGTAPSLASVAKVYFDHWNARSGVYRSATVSVVSTSAMDAVAEAVADIISQNENKFSPEAGTQHLDRLTPHIFYDLKAHISSFATPQQAARLEQSLEKAVIYKAATDEFIVPFNGFRIEDHCGLTIFAPQESTRELNGYYSTLQWSAATDPQGKYLDI